jgi:hypothetical protein
VTEADGEADGEDGNSSPDRREDRKLNVVPDAVPLGRESHEHEWRSDPGLGYTYCAVCFEIYDRSSAASA